MKQAYYKVVCVSCHKPARTTRITHRPCGESVLFCDECVVATQRLPVCPFCSQTGTPAGEVASGQR